MMKAGAAAGLMVLIFTGFASAGATARERSALERDVEGYAIAACFARQSEPLLKDQGGAWASAIVQRSHGDFAYFKPVASAVDAELRRAPVAVGHDEATGADKPLPVLRCGEIVDAPPIRAALAKAEARLASAYRRR